MSNMSNMFEAVFLGTNGSCPYNNGKRTKYGTNTLCLAVRAGDETIIFDAGTGICSFDALPDMQSNHISIFLSHYHTDHIGGLLFFPCFFDDNKRIDIYAPGSPLQTVKSYLSPPLHPVGLEAMKAEISVHEINDGCNIRLSGDVAVKTHALNHPGGALGYRVEYEGKALCYCVDAEFSKHRDDDGLLSFMADADLLLLDSAFDDGKVIEGWGHSSWKECAVWAKRAKAKKMALYHYGYTMTDKDIDMMEEKAREIFPDVIASADFMRIDLTGDQ